MHSGGWILSLFSMESQQTRFRANIKIVEPRMTPRVLTWVNLKKKIVETNSGRISGIPFGLQLFLEQHGFELHRFTYMWLFSKSNYCTSQSVVCWIQGCAGTSDTDSQLNVSYIWINPCIVQESTTVRLEISIVYPSGGSKLGVMFKEILIKDINIRSSA